MTIRFQQGRKAMAMAVIIAASVLLSGATASDLTPAPEGSFVVLQPAIMTAGSSRTYVVDSVIESDIPEGTSPERSRRVFRIDVLSAQEGRRVLGYTITSYDGAAFPELAQAMIGRRFDYEASSSGYPIRLTNWSDRRAEMIMVLQGNGGSGIVSHLLAVPEARVPELVLNDTVMVASMQSWRGMAKPRIDDEPRFPAPGARLLGYKELAGFGAQDCTFGIRRVTELDPKSEYAVAAKTVERLETYAIVSMVDGWVVSLEETARRERGGHKELVSKKMAREVRSSPCPMTRFEPPGQE